MRLMVLVLVKAGVTLAGGGVEIELREIMEPESPATS
jgi:hypothetical protein